MTKRTKDYSKSIIYMLTSVSGKIYIGSTPHTKEWRFKKHKDNYHSWKRGKTHYVTSFDLFEEGEVKIEVIQNFPCSTEKELHTQEGYLIKQTPECVNRNIPGRSLKEYREDNKKKIQEYREANKEKIQEWRKDNKEKLDQKAKEYREANKETITLRMKEYYEDNKDIYTQKNKKYYEDNKEKIMKRRKEKVQCECGRDISRTSLAAHKKTAVHLNNI